MSINKITYLDQIIPNNFFVFTRPSMGIINTFEFSEFKSFLNTLDSDKTYVVTFEFICSWLLYDEDSPLLTLSKPILVTKNSNHMLLSQFVWQKVNLAITNYSMIDDILDIIGKPEGPGVIVKYNPINLF